MGNPRSSTDSGRENATPDQQPAKLYALRGIYREDSNRRASDWRFAAKDRASPSEMIGPSIAPRIEKPLETICERVVSCNVWTFKRIAR
jgi:hypothetical protein